MSLISNNNCYVVALLMFVHYYNLKILSISKTHYLCFCIGILNSKTGKFDVCNVVLHEGSVDMAESRVKLTLTSV